MDARVEQLKYLHHKLGSSPAINWFLGVAVLGFWACGTVVEIQTSEFLAMGLHNQVAGVAWSILIQPWMLLTGQAPVTLATAWEYAWVVETITLVFSLALTAAIAKISSVNKHLATWFVIGGGLLILLNGYSDYSASPGATPLIHFLIALAIGGIVVVGLPLGVGLIEHGFAEW